MVSSKTLSVIHDVRYQDISRKFVYKNSNWSCFWCFVHLLRIRCNFCFPLKVVNDILVLLCIAKKTATLYILSCMHMHCIFNALFSLVFVVCKKVVPSQKIDHSIYFAMFLSSKNYVFPSSKQHKHSIHLKIEKKWSLYQTTERSSQECNVSVSHMTYGILKFLLFWFTLFYFSWVYGNLI